VPTPGTPGFFPGVVPGLPGATPGLPGVLAVPGTPGFFPGTGLAPGLPTGFFTTGFFGGTE